MNTLQVYKIINQVVTKANAICAAMNADTVTKDDAVERFKTLLNDAKKAISD